MHYFSFQIPLFSSKLFSKREITRLLFFSLQRGFFFTFVRSQYNGGFVKLVKKPRGDALSDHQDEARAVAFHVRSAEKQRVSINGANPLPYFSVIDSTQVVRRVSNLNILALIFAHNYNAAFMCPFPSSFKILQVMRIAGPSKATRKRPQPKHTKHKYPTLHSHMLPILDPYISTAYSDTFVA
ncbi:hypothetical protein NC652_009176 [Populus alba x Populus x berolinensis]|nr:hypothetical protein NC652_009176 [Populus alba x Populus x berolinensis]